MQEAALGESHSSDKSTPAEARAAGCSPSRHGWHLLHPWTRSQTRVFTPQSTQSFVGAAFQSWTRNFKITPKENSLNLHSSI